MALHKNWSRSVLVIECPLIGNRRLGRNQARVLRCLLEFGTFPGTWRWNTERQTVKVLESLARRGLVATQTIERTDWHGQPTAGEITYYRPVQWMRDVMDAPTHEEAVELLEGVK